MSRKDLRILTGKITRTQRRMHTSRLIRVDNLTSLRIGGGMISRFAYTRLRRE
jgi:hypothetical protein